MNLDQIERFLIFMAVSITLILPIAIYKSFKHESRLMKQCLDDGHKEYHCESMVKKGHTPTVVIPAIR